MRDFQPGLSIIIPCYNYAKYVFVAIDSILTQMRDNVEIIVIDDASTDNSRTVILSYGAKIKPILQSVNGGHARAFNTGFEIAKYQLVMFLDADDFLLPDAIDTIFKVYDPSIGLYHFRMRQSDGEGVLGDFYPPMQKSLAGGDISKTLRQIGRYDSTVTSGMVFASSILSKVMPIDEEAFRFAGDGYLASVVPLYAPCASYDETISAYRIHGVNHSQFSKNLFERSLWKIDHDKARYRAIEFHAKKLGLEVASDLGLRDELFIEQKMTLILKQTSQKLRYSSRGDLARLGLKAMWNQTGSNVKMKSKFTQGLWWLILGWAPLSWTKTLLEWKINASSRPQFIKNLALFVRTRMGVMLK